jgi:hypothetical protein
MEDAVALNRLAASFQPRKLAQMVHRCSADQAAFEKYAAAVSFGTAAPQVDMPSPETAELVHDRSGAWAGSIDVSGSGSSVCAAFDGPNFAAGRQERFGEAAMFPNAPTRSTCAYGQLSLRQRVPHEQLLSATQYRYLLTKYTQPPLQESLATWHRDLRKYNDGGSGGVAGARVGGSSNAARAADGAGSRGSDAHALPPSRAPCHATRENFASGPRTGPRTGGSATKPSATPELHADTLRTRLWQDIRDLELTSHQLREEYCMQPPHGDFAFASGSNNSNTNIGGGAPSQLSAEAGAQPRPRQRGATSPNMSSSNSSVSTATRATQQAVVALTDFVKRRARQLSATSPPPPPPPEVEIRSSDDRAVVSRLGRSLGSGTATATATDKTDGPFSSDHDRRARGSEATTKTDLSTAAAPDYSTGKAATPVARTRSSVIASLTVAPFVCGESGFGADQEEEEEDPSRTAQARFDAGFAAALRAVATSRGGRGLLLRQPWLRATQAQLYLEGVRIAVTQFCKRHAAPVRACMQQAASFSRQRRTGFGATTASDVATAAASSPWTASAPGLADGLGWLLPENAIDVQIAARRAQRLRCRYVLAALFLYRDMVLLRTRLLAGLQERRCVHVVA